MPGVVWFGTKDYAQWVPAPSVNVTATKQGFAAQASFVSGGAWVRRSKNAAKRYEMSWGLKHRSEIQPILDYADGIYGPGYLYYSDPFAMDKNVLPAYWAAPFMNAYDGPLRINKVTRPTLNTAQIVNGYPAESAIFALTPSSAVPSIYIPIPPGYRAYVGVHGANLSGTTAVAVREHVGTTVGSPINMNWLFKNGSPTTDWISNANATGITMSLRATATGSMRIDGIVVQVLPSGSPGPVGGFISGQGTSGMEFVETPAVSQYNAVLDRVGVSAVLMETEAWA